MPTIMASPLALTPERVKAPAAQLKLNGQRGGQPAESPVFRQAGPSEGGHTAKQHEVGRWASTFGRRVTLWLTTISVAPCRRGGDRQAARVDVDHEQA
jgi:hypothetical protein